MADKSAIEWTDATWNPIVGCSIVSPGCTNCYAMKMAGRIQKINRTGGSNSNYVNHYDGTTQASKAGAVWTGKVARAPDKLFLKPLSWRTPRRIFVNSMGDLFHESIPDAWIDRVFAVMALCPQHAFQVLTKRAERMRDYFNLSREKLHTRWLWAARDVLGLRATGFINGAWPLPNVWLGVSAERQKEADERIPLLLQTPAAVRFISAEPLLGPIDLNVFHDVDTPKVGHPLIDIGAMTLIEGLDWVIVGGESGPRARPMHPDWARRLRDQCAAAGIPFFFKQWGEWGPDEGILAGGRDPVMEGAARCGVWNGKSWKLYPDGYMPPTSAGIGEWVYRLGKKTTGRLLNSVEHNEFPRVRKAEAA